MIAVAHHEDDVAGMRMIGVLAGQRLTAGVLPARAHR
jgi:hypothetical protein